MSRSERKRNYATVVADDGVNYREIADTMTEIGFSMNHSSARNYVLRIMKKFAEALVLELGVDKRDPVSLDAVAKSPHFQSGIADLLHVVEMERRQKNSYLEK